jgi:hypothetical protein
LSTPQLKIGSKSPLVQKFLNDGDTLSEVLYLPDVKKHLRDLLLIKDCINGHYKTEDIQDLEIFISSFLSNFLEDLPASVPGISFCGYEARRDQTKKPIDITEIEEFFD